MDPTHNKAYNVNQQRGDQPNHSCHNREYKPRVTIEELLTRLAYSLYAFSCEDLRFRSDSRYELVVNDRTPSYGPD